MRTRSFPWPPWWRRCCRSSPPSPGPGPQLTGVVQVAGGRDHSLALRSDGTAWAFGHNIYGQLGDGTTTRRTTPVPVLGLSGVETVTADRGYSAAL
jgi:alpha-tubulin suppressor-like RCC1 family protein